MFAQFEHIFPHFPSQEGQAPGTQKLDWRITGRSLQYSTVCTSEGTFALQGNHIGYIRQDAWVRDASLTDDTKPNLGNANCRLLMAIFLFHLPSWDLNNYVYHSHSPCDHKFPQILI